MHEYDLTLENENPEIEVTKVCSWCSETSSLKMALWQYDLHRKRERLVQDIFPNVPKDIREVLISGTHPECWDEMMAGLDDEDDEIEEIGSYVGNE